VGLASPGVRGEERQRTNLQSRGWCNGVRDGDGSWGRRWGHCQQRRGRQQRHQGRQRRWRGVEGGGVWDDDGVGDDYGVTAGGVEAEGGDGAASREATEAPREAASMAWHRGRRQHRGRETWAA
jgi:hypothetical protein